MNKQLKKILKIFAYATASLVSIYILFMSIAIPYYVSVLESFEPASSQYIVEYYNLKGDTPAAYDFNHYKDVVFETEDGITLSGWYIESQEKSDKCLYMIHGWKSSGVACLSVLEIIKEYEIDKNSNIFIIHLRNSGNSSKVPSDLGYKTSKDVFEGMKFLNREYNIDKINIFAISMGAMATSTALNLYEDKIDNLGIEIGKILFDSPLSNAKNAIQSKESAVAQLLDKLLYEPFFLVIDHRWDNMLNKLNLSTMLATIDTSNIMILQSEKDRLTKLSALKKQIKDIPVKVKIFEQGAHARIFQSNRREYKKIFSNYFKD